MKKFNILLFISTVLIISSCNRGIDEAEQIVSKESIWEGDWKILKYVVIDNLNNQVIKELQPECSGKSVYQFRKDNFLNVKMYRNVVGGDCLDSPTSDSGKWNYNENNMSLTMYDSTYKVKSLTESKAEIVSFDEGYVDFHDSDYNNDGVNDKVITVLVKQ